jgi:hypothetical protein
VDDTAHPEIDMPVFIGSSDQITFIRPGEKLMGPASHLPSLRDITQYLDLIAHRRISLFFSPSPAALSWPSMQPGKEWGPPLLTFIFLDHCCSPLRGGQTGGSLPATNVIPSVLRI